MPTKLQLAYGWCSHLAVSISERAARCRGEGPDNHPLPPPPSEVRYINDGSCSTLFLRPVSHLVLLTLPFFFLCRSVLVRHERQGLLRGFQGTQSIYQSSDIIYYSAAPYIKPLIKKKNSWTRNTKLIDERPAMRLEQSTHSQALPSIEDLSLMFWAIEWLSGFCYRMEISSPILPYNFNVLRCA